MADQLSLRADVLVIGGGGGGCRAAIEAASRGSKVILVAKGPLGRSGLTPMTMPGMAASFGTRDKDDSPDVHFRDTLKGGYNLGNQKRLRTFVTRAPQEVRFLEGLGVRFDRTEKGEIEQLPLPGHTKRRSCWLDDNMGRVLGNALRMELSRRQVQILEDFFVTDILVDDGRAIGAAGVWMDTGQPVVIAAKAVVLATGGSEALYPFRSSTPRATGDGIALAYNAGAEITDMEFMQFSPYVFIWPKAALSVCVPADTTLMAMGAKYLNNQGERFLQRYDPERMEMTTRDIQSRAMFMEIQAGRGSEHGGVYLDCRGLTDYDGKSPETIVKTQGGCVSDYLKVAGVDILTQVVELAPAAHFGIGGVRINEKAETSLRGLYAAGEVSGGLHGANRLAANSMPEIFVFGGIAGESASRYAAQAEPPPANACWESGQERVRRAFDLLESARGRTRVREAKSAIEQTMFSCFGIVRDPAGMQAGLDKLDGIEHGEMTDLLIPDRSPVMNYDWVEALESEKMIVTGRILGAGALHRQESRGAHYRSDIPQMVESWQKNTVIRREGENMQIRLCDPDERWQS